MKARLINLALQHEDDVVTMRQQARHLAAILGFDTQDQTRIATAVSEIARNAVTYGGGGRAQFFVESDSPPQLLVIEVIDRGPGIKHLADILAGRYRSPTGMGKGIVGARRLLDGFEVDTSDTGTRVIMRKVLPRSAPLVRSVDLPRLVGDLEQQLRNKGQRLLDELKQQNRELVQSLEEMENRQKELTRLSAELFDTNRGVVALYAELDEKADHLRRADDLKTRFLSNMSHEFRTPLNSILALSRLLLDRVDGPLTEEQERQIGYMRSSANDLLELVNDLLDLAKVEAGKTVVRAAPLSIENLFAALRGMMRPLLASKRVELVFEDVRTVPELVADEAKVAQILRNFLSNAVKFTQRGEIRVGARFVPAHEKGAGLHDSPPQDSVVMWVSDTGIGIAPQDQDRIFEEFAQVENPLQASAKGTGLGLPLCRKLARVMGGSVWVESEPGVGSRFFLLLPRDQNDAQDFSIRGPLLEERGSPVQVLLVTDRTADRQAIESHLKGSVFTLLSAERVNRARELLVGSNPSAVILDVDLKLDDAWRFLPELTRQNLPVALLSDAQDPQKAFELGVCAFGTRPVTRDWLMDTLYRVLVRPRVRTVLIADDDVRIRSILRRLLTPYAGAIVEAENGLQAQQLAQELQPDLLMLDLMMPVQDGLTTLRHLRTQPGTETLPVVICTSKMLGDREQAEIAALGAHFFSKSELERQPLIEAIVATTLRNRGQSAPDAGADISSAGEAS